MQHIRSIVDVTLSLLKSNPPQLLVSSVGTVSSGGWKNPSLDLRYYVIPPADGIQDYDFTATPPVGSAIQVILPIAAQDVIVNIPSWLKGLRIHSATNFVEAHTASSNELDLFMSPIECHSKDWKAWKNTMSGKTPTLHVTGKVTCPTGGHTAKLIPVIPQGFNPLIYLLDLEVTPPPPGQIVTQAFTDVLVHYSEDTDAAYTSIDIQPDGISVKVESVS